MYLVIFWQINLFNLLTYYNQKGKINDNDDDDYDDDDDDYDDDNDDDDVDGMV